jgi:hypothetical protein
MLVRTTMSARQQITREEAKPAMVTRHCMRVGPPTGLIRACARTPTPRAIGIGVPVGLGIDAMLFIGTTAFPTLLPGDV